MSQETRFAVGVIGLGIIGSRVAECVRKAGHTLAVWNRTPKDLAGFAKSPADVAERSEFIQLFVANAEATLSVVDAMSPALTSRHVILSHGTIGRDGTLDAAKRVQARGAQFLDAPFTGSKGAAENGQLVYYLGGDRALADRARPVLAASSKAILHVGEIGQAAVIKVATNLISAATVQVLAEALALTQAAGIRGEVLAEAVGLNAMRSGLTDMKLPKMLSHDYEPHFSLKHMLKDVRLGAELARQLGIQLPATETVGQSMAAGVEQGWGDLDYGVVAKSFEIAGNGSRQ